jgi:hypothetical protein
MATTPEGKVKRLVKQYLKDAGAYQFWPVQTGMGSRTLDCLGCHKRRAFAIETKAPGKQPTEQQLWLIQQMQLAGMAVFVIDSTDTSTPAWMELIAWLERDQTVIYR